MDNWPKWKIQLVRDFKSGKPIDMLTITYRSYLHGKYKHRDQVEQIIRDWMRERSE